MAEWNVGHKWTYNHDPSFAPHALRGTTRTRRPVPNDVAVSVLSLRTMSIRVKYAIPPHVDAPKSVRPGSDEMAREARRSRGHS